VTALDRIADLFLTTQQYELAEATNIPTLSEWAQVGMAALLVLGGLAALRPSTRSGCSGPALRRRRLAM